MFRKLIISYISKCHYSVCSVSETATSYSSWGLPQIHRHHSHDIYIRVCDDVLSAYKDTDAVVPIGDGIYEFISIDTEADETKRTEDVSRMIAAMCKLHVYDFDEGLSSSSLG